MRARGLAATEITLKDWAIESMRHSLFATEHEGAVAEWPAVPSPFHAGPRFFRDGTVADKCGNAPARPFLAIAQRNERRVEEPAEPDAFAFAVVADEVHAVGGRSSRRAIKGGRARDIERAGESAGAC